MPPKRKAVVQKQAAKVASPTTKATPVKQPAENATEEAAADETSTAEETTADIAMDTPINGTDDGDMTDDTEVTIKPATNDNNDVEVNVGAGAEDEEAGAEDEVAEEDMEAEEINEGEDVACEGVKVEGGEGEDMEAEEVNKAEGVAVEGGEVKDATIANVKADTNQTTTKEQTKKRPKKKNSKYPAFIPTYSDVSIDHIKHLNSRTVLIGPTTMADMSNERLFTYIQKTTHFSINFNQDPQSKEMIGCLELQFADAEAARLCAKSLTDEKIREDLIIHHMYPNDDKAPEGTRGGRYQAEDSAGPDILRLLSYRKPYRTLADRFTNRVLVVSGLDDTVTEDDIREQLPKATNMFTPYSYSRNKKKGYMNIEFASHEDLLEVVGKDITIRGYKYKTHAPKSMMPLKHLIGKFDKVSFDQPALTKGDRQLEVLNGLLECCTHYAHWDCTGFDQQFKKKMATRAQKLRLYLGIQTAAAKKKALKKKREAMANQETAIGQAPQGKEAPANPDTNLTGTKRKNKPRNRAAKRARLDDDSVDQEESGSNVVRGGGAGRGSSPGRGGVANRGAAQGSKVGRGGIANRGAVQGSKVGRGGIANRGAVQGSKVGRGGIANRGAAQGSNVGRGGRGAARGGSVGRGRGGMNYGTNWVRGGFMGGGRGGHRDLDNTSQTATAVSLLMGLSTLLKGADKPVRQRSVDRDFNRSGDFNRGRDTSRDGDYNRSYDGYGDRGQRSSGGYESGYANQQSYKTTGYNDSYSQQNTFSCYKCGEEGHISRNCPTGDTRSCYKCGEGGHISKDCPTGGGSGCFTCGQEGHVARDCPKGGRGGHGHSGQITRW